MRIVALLAIVGCFLTHSVIAQEQHDFRLVNGIRVDLGPLDAWLAHPDGDRPLKHWKALRLQAALEPVGGYPVYHALADGSATDIAVRNLPQDTAEFMASLNSRAVAISNLTAAVKSLDWQIQHDTANTHMARRSYAYVKASARQELADMQTRLHELQSENNKALAQASKKTTVLAMFTGKSYSSTPIWDCGQKQ